MSDTVFENSVVAESMVPEVEGLEFAPLAPTYARTLIIESSIFFTILAIIPAVINWFVGEGWLLTQWWFYALWAFFTLSPFIWAPMVAASRGFSMREKDIHYKSGLIWRKTVSLPYNRIQHVEIESGPLERIFKLTTLKFFTAGGAMSDMKIPALEFDRSSKLRAFVMEKAGVSEVETHNAN